MARQRNLRRCALSSDREVSGQLVNRSRDRAHDRRVGQIERNPQPIFLVESFEHFWTYTSPTWADKFLKAWTQRVARSRLAPLKRVAKSLVKHRALLLNYFIARKEYSSGVVEGLNNKLKLTLKKSYGFRTDLARKVALYHTLAHLPEPPLTHSFF